MTSLFDVRRLLKMEKTVKTIWKLPKFVRLTTRKHSIWTQEGIVKSPYKNIDLPNCTLSEYVFQNLEKWAHRTAAICSDTGRAYTYEQVNKKSNTLAANLRKKLRIADGESVAVMLPNIPEFPVVAFGILRAGGVITTINPIYTAHEVQRQLVMSQAKAIITLPEIAKVVKKALEIAKLNIPIIVVKTNTGKTPDGTILYNELTDDPNVDTSCLKEVRRSPADICFMPYSSGTTGLPKGVELTNWNIIANCEQMNEPKIRCHNDTTDSHQDNVMAVLPFFHIYGATVAMFHKMSNGTRLVTLPKFQPESYLRALEEFKTNVIFVAPPLVLLKINHPAATAKTFQYIDVMFSGAAPLAASDAARFEKKAQRKIDFRQGYGLTETSPVVTMTPIGLDDFGVIGYPLPSTELKIVDSNLNNLGPNETGELLVRGPQVMKGYKDNPKANSETLTEDGWFRTGDLAVIDDRGITTLKDRLKELIKVKGFQVPPAELEAVLREHPSVTDAAVIGVPHSTNGEAPKAFVVLKKDTNVKTEEISAFVKERVAPYKRIDDITFIDTVPKSATGKILRRELKDKYC